MTHILTLITWTTMLWTVTWNPMIADSFIVQWDTNRDTTYAVECDTIALSQTVEGVTTARIKAVLNGIESDWSLPVTATFLDYSNGALFTFDTTLVDYDTFMVIMRLPMPPSMWTIDDQLVPHCQADLNGDGMVNLTDLSIFGEVYQWSEPEGGE